MFDLSSRAVMAFEGYRLHRVIPKPIRPARAAAAWALFDDSPDKTKSADDAVPRLQIPRFPDKTSKLDFPPLRFNPMSRHACAY
jgi:hypothetical protein